MQICGPGPADIFFMITYTTCTASLSMYTRSIQNMEICIVIASLKFQFLHFMDLVNKALPAKYLSFDFFVITFITRLIQNKIYNYCVF
jgi:hypothetical protein